MTKKHYLQVRISLKGKWHTNDHGGKTIGYEATIEGSDIGRARGVLELTEGAVAKSILVEFRTRTNARKPWSEWREHRLEEDY